MGDTAVEVAGGVLEVYAVGQGPMVILIPSAGRGAADFDDLAARLAAAGFLAVAPEPRGVGGSTAPLDSLAMADLACDVAAVVRAVGAPTARPTVVGHAFGNRVARMTATEHPEVVRDVALLDGAGHVLLPEHPAAVADALTTWLRR